MAVVGAFITNTIISKKKNGKNEAGGEHHE
jgi:formate dehydrogenase iron-sulfur subunit